MKNLKNSQGVRISIVTHEVPDMYKKALSNYLKNDRIKRAQKSKTHKKIPGWDEVEA